MPDAAPTALSPGPALAKLPLRRPESGRWFAGVCAGIAEHLGVRVRWVRLLMVLATLAFGAGLVAYLFWWVSIPLGDARLAARESQPVAALPLARRLAPALAQSGMARRDILIGLALIVMAGLGLAIRVGWYWQNSWLLPVILAVSGLAVAWGAGSARFPDVREALAGFGKTRPGWLRLIFGIALVVTGLLVFTGQGANWAEFVSVLPAVLVVGFGVALVLAPWWVQLLRRINSERAARIRETERADIAAHLHDSVLQTLTLIRGNSHDAEAVARLARTQERELREWLYADRPVTAGSFAAQLRQLVSQIEDGTIGKTGAPATAIEVVTVGDCAPDDGTATLFAATREALVNAVTHGRPPVSLYLEATDNDIQVFVRDRGDGFELSEVSPDRHGVRNSILARMQRRGGSAEIVSRLEWGTEVRLSLPAG